MDNLIEEREKRYKRRKKEKRDFDKSIDLAYENDIKVLTMPTKSLSTGRIRLLDEGAIVGDGWVDCFIKKGTIEKYLNGENEHLDNLDDDYVGNVNLGHMDFSTFPFIIGTWTKKDLHLVEIDNDRHAVDVDLHLDDDSVFVQELARQPYDIGVSAEFYYHTNEEDTEMLSEAEGTYIPVIDEICIKAYGLVGECGNVNSDGLELKGGQDMTKTKNLNIEMEGVEELTSEIEEAKKALAELEEAEMEVEIDAEEETEEQETEEEPEKDEEEECSEDKCDEECDKSCDGCKEESAEEEVEEVEADEAEVEDDDDDESDDEEDEDEADAIGELEQVFAELKAQNEELQSELKALRAKNKQLQKRNKAMKKEISEFADNFKGLSIALGFKEEVKEKAAEPTVALSDGIGE